MVRRYGEDILDGLEWNEEDEMTDGGEEGDTDARSVPEAPKERRDQARSSSSRKR